MQDLNGQDDREDSRELNVVEERQLLSRYGIWLLVGQCAPDENTPDVSDLLMTHEFIYYTYMNCCLCNYSLLFDELKKKTLL